MLLLRGCVLLLFICAARSMAAPPAQSAWVSVAADGRLLYHRDELGNRLPDFGDCGYRAGRAAIPEVPVKVVVKPGGADDRARIQAALDQVATLPPDAQGLRGAVLLQAGEYRLDGPITMRANGVVLRGEGATEKGTILRATARQQHTLIALAGTGSTQVAGLVRQIVDKYVPVGARSFNVDDTRGLAVGDTVTVLRPSTAAWIHALGMDQLKNPWKPGDRDVAADRVITRIEGQRVFLDAPITTALDGQYGGGRIWKTAGPERVEQCGVENLRGISDTDGTDTDEQHGWIFIGVSRAQNCWVRGVVSEHFGYACVSVTSNSKWVSVLDCESLDPVAQITGGRRYAFNLDDAQLCLIKDCRTRHDRHQFVTGSNTCGPNAFVAGTSDAAHADAGPHHRWASGILWDNITVNGHDLDMQNRGNLGSGHGWAGANCVLWNCQARNFVVQNPPTARNWLIGCVGTIKDGTVFVGPHEPGTSDAHGTPVEPASLYAAQHRDLRAQPGLQVREYVTGDFDHFALDPTDAVPVDPAWQRAFAASGPTATFDAPQPGCWVPWTQTFTLDPGDLLVSATLQVCVRAAGGDGAQGRIFIGDATTPRPLGALATKDATVLRFDLAADLAPLRQGRLNVAVGPDLAVDWAVLELRVAHP